MWSDLLGRNQGRLIFSTLGLFQWTDFQIMKDQFWAVAAAAAAKSLQSCLTLCDPIDGSPPGPSIPGILQARTLEWVAISFSTNLPKFAQIYVHWVDDTIQQSLSATLFSSCPQSFPASGSFSMSLLFASGGQSIGVSASALFLPMNTQDWSRLGWTHWISLQSKGLSRVFSNTTVQSINSSMLSFLHSPTLTSIHDHWKNHSLD